MSNFPATQPTLVMPFSGMDTTTRMQQLLDSWGATYTGGGTSGGQKSFTNKLGLIEKCSLDLPRPNFDPVTKENKGILIEEARTNLLERSEEFDNAYWTKVNVTVTANNAVAPDGEQTADLIVPSTSNVEHRVERILSTTLTEHYKSFFVKPSGYNVFQITTLSSDYVNYDLSTQSVFESSSSVSGSIEEYPNGWYRVIFSRTLSSTSDRARIAIVPSISSTRFETFTGDGTSGIFLWGAQLEEGSSATSYIPTTSASVTRNADVCSISGTAFSDFYNQSEGTFLAEYEANADGGYVFLANDNSNDNQLGLLISSNEQRLFVRTNDANQIINSASGSVLNLNTKGAVTWSGGTYNHYKNGALISTSTGVLNPEVSRLDLGSREVVGSNVLNGCIKRLAYYPSALTDAQTQKLTRTTS